MYINQRVDEKDYMYIVFFRKCLFEQSEYMFIHLEGKYNSSKGNEIILGRIMVIDAHLKNVKCVNNVREKIHCRNN